MSTSNDAVELNKTLITGATGLVGFHTTKELLRKGRQVRAAGLSAMTGQASERPSREGARLEKTPTDAAIAATMASLA